MKRRSSIVVGCLTLIAIPVSIAMIFVSCSKPLTSHVSQRKATTNTRYVNQHNIIQLPLIVDLEIEDRIVSGSFSGDNVSEAHAKEMAVANALKTSDADVLVEPIYDLTINNNTISASVRGHPGHYKNFRKPKSPDDKGSGVKLRYVKP